MGAKVQTENYMHGHYSMRDISRESNGTSWSPWYGFLSRPFGDLHSEYHKDGVKKTILEHETTFKNQVYELHRLYQVQRDLMDKVRMKEQFSRQLPYEASSSSSPVPSQMQYEDVQRWNNSICNGPSALGPHYTKGKNIQAGPSLFQNSHSPRNSEVSESRPTKCRRKMFDLQLPASEYVDDSDEVEQFGDVKVSDNTFFTPNRSFSKSKILADLNDPIYVEETTDVSSVNFLSHAGSQYNLLREDISKNLLSSSKDVPQNSRHGSLNGTLTNLPFNNRPNNQDWCYYALESEKHKGGFRTMNGGIHEQKPKVPSQVVQVPLDEGFQPPAFHHMKGDPRKAKYGGMVEKSNRSYNPSSYNISDQIRSSHIPNHQPSFFYHSDLGKSLDHCASSWGKPGGFLDQRPIQVQATPFLSSFQSNTSGGGDPSLRNGFYQNSSTSFREVTPASFTPPRFDHANCNYNIDKKKPMRDVNLNVAPLSSDDIDHKSEHWNALETAQSRGLPFGSSSCHGEIKANNKPESNNYRKVMGVPIFESPSIVKKEDSVIASPSSVDHHRRRILFDMNLPCEPEIEEVVIVEKEIQTKSATVVNQFDLNSCITEEDTPCGTGIDLEAPVIIESDEEKEPEKHPEGEDDRSETEFARSAAEAIIAMSSLSSSVNNNPNPFTDVEDALNWFVGIACFIENKGSLHVLDDFESMTLNLKECSFEEYFPKPSFPEIPKIEETLGSGRCATRTRRGQTRRGRQRRDFQRDILPGLTSLSRHEVTEDLQTFGGLMRDTGHEWNSCPNRTRNGSTRGRRKSVVRAPVNTELCPPILTKEHISNAEVGVVDRSLTGWGKTTRRPRRQRYSAGNPVPLT